jgi:hypothetical protein
MVSPLNIPDIPVTQEDINRAWKPKSNRFQCSMCNKHFPQQQGLVGHLESTVHAPKLYFCARQGCEEHFANLSGVLKHMEWKCRDERWDTTELAALGFVEWLRSWSGSVGNAFMQGGLAPLGFNTEGFGGSMRRI